MALVDVDTTVREVERRLTAARRDRAGAAFRFVLLTALLFALAFLVILLVTVLIKGAGVFFDRGLDFLTSGTSGSSLRAGVGQGIVGSALIGLFVVLVAFPLGVASAVYLEEYAPDTRFTRFVTVNIRNLAGVPSIVYGILGFTIFVKGLGGFTGGRSVVSAGLTLAVLVLPIVIITATEALRAVPVEIREAGFGVGAGRWEVVRHHVLPYAAPGILTGTVLSLARALGEAAPLILVGAVFGYFANASGASLIEGLRGPFTALPNITYNWARQPGQHWPELTAAAIIVMLVVILTFNAAAIVLRNRYDRKRVG